MSDIIERYDAADRAGRARVPNRAIEAFALEWWNVAGYPYRIASLDELWRYHDSMHDGRYEKNLRLLGDVADDEVELCRRAARLIYDFSASRFRFASPGRDALTRALYQYRLLAKQLEQATSPWTILEIGPGSGYLGLLLGLAGHRYLAVEAAQAFYVYQSELWRFAFGTDYDDGLERLGPSRIQHVPWWTFNEEHLQLPALDASTSNHALAEMHPGAVRRVFSVTDRFAAPSGFLLAESLGRRHHSTSEVTDCAGSSGFDSVQIAPKVWVFRRARSAPSVVNPPSPHTRLQRSAATLLLRLPGGRRAVSLITRRRRIDDRASVEQPFQSRLEPIFDHYPSSATPDYRYLAGDW